MIWSDESVFMLFPTSWRFYVCRTPQEAQNPKCLVPIVKHVGRSVMVLAVASWYSMLLVPLLPFMAELLQGSMWTGWVIRCIPWSGRYFQTAMRFFKMTVPQFWNCSVMVWRTWRWTSASSLVSTVTKSEHHWTTLVSFGDLSEEQILPPTSLNQLEVALQEEWYQTPLETVQNLYESIPRTAAVSKAKGGPKPH
jgi:hypothetical protein